MQPGEPVRAMIEAAQIQDLIDLLRDQSYQVIGPTIRDATIAYDYIDSIDALPKGWTDRHGAGTYRLQRRDDDALFGYVVGPTSWKPFLYPPKQSLWEAKRDGTGVVVKTSIAEPPTYAFLGVRSCDLHAMAIHDRVFLGGAYQDDDYAGRRSNAFIIAVNCTESGESCFCVSMKTGPAAESGYDLALTELLQEQTHRFLVTSGSERGRKFLEQLGHRLATEADCRDADAAIEHARQGMGRSMDTEGLREDLLTNLEHPHWRDVASRCLSCANCTMVCPTCFCSTVVDTTDLTGEQTQRWRQWDSCFTADFSYVHGGSIRQSTESRYRQWLTHKLAHWIDQFDTSGCVGCGRCITWCPVGIDLTEEVQAIREKNAHQDELS